MSIFEFEEKESLGRVLSVDTSVVIVEVDDVDRLQTMQVNRLVAVESAPGQHLIGLIQKITRKINNTNLETLPDDMEVPAEHNLVRIGLIGTHFDKRKQAENVFTRSIESVPRINASCFPIEEKRLTDFMRVIAQVGVDEDAPSLQLGTYSLDEEAEAYLHGDRFFQRHAILVGSTGSGKSWTTARILEQVAELPNANAIVFDIHGEYGPLQGDGFSHYKVAGPGDLDNGRGLEDGIIYLPYWLLSYDALVPLFVDRSDTNAPNQTVLMTQYIRESKERILTELGREDILQDFTIDSPVPFDVHEVLENLRNRDTEREEGAKAGTTRNGPFHGKLTRLVTRLDSKINDRRLGFLFRGESSLEYLDRLAEKLIAGGVDLENGSGGVKIIDFSEVPSDVMPLIISMVARMIFSLQQWNTPEQRHPIALFCDEAHNYIPDRSVADPTADISIHIFERIAKEGRKYGVGLVVISQRPSEVNKTVLSQCNNMVAMRLTNSDDQNRIKALLPDNLGSFGDLLPTLDTGEALVVGDASILPSRVRIHEPIHKPNSATIPFWQCWGSTEGKGGVAAAVENWRRQNIQQDE